jgi:hypothetical protein
MIVFFWFDFNCTKMLAIWIIWCMCFVACCAFRWYMKKDSIVLHIKHICILVSWLSAQYLHFAVVSLQMLIKCSNFWHLWHWLIRLFKNFVTCKILSFTIRIFFNAFSASFFNFRLILTNEYVLFFRFSFLVNQIDLRAIVKSLYVFISFWNRFIDLSNAAISTSCTIWSN